MTTTERLELHYLFSVGAALIGIGLLLGPGFVNGLYAVNGTTDSEMTPFQTVLGATGLVLLAVSAPWLLVTRVRMWLQPDAQGGR